MSESESDKFLVIDILLFGSHHRFLISSIGDAPEYSPLQTKTEDNHSF